MLLWAAGMYCSSSFSDFRATTSSFRLQFFSSQLLISSLHLESVYLIKSSSTFLLFALPSLEVLSVLTLYLTTLGTHSNLARMTSPLLQSGVTMVVEPMPHSQ